MHRRLLISLAAFTVLGSTACDSPQPDPSDVPTRDLTTSLIAEPERQVASPLEMGRPRTVPPPETESIDATPTADPIEAPPGSASPIPMTLRLIITGELVPPRADEIPSGMVAALAPGQTVRIIPTNHPSGFEDDHDLPLEPRHGVLIRAGTGGSCKPRGIGGVLF
jgi:hypothetical protein